MYIILESLASDDPLMVPEIEIQEPYKWWIYNIAYIKPENINKVNLSEISYAEVDEVTAKAAKFGHADRNLKISIAEGSTIHDELSFCNSLEPHDYKPKYKYTLSAEDKNQLLKFWKAVARLALESHYKNNLTQELRDFNRKYKQQILNEIESITEIDKFRLLWHTRFGLECHSKELAKDAGFDSPTIDLSRKNTSA